MLKAHFDAVEQKLLSEARIPSNAGHSLHKGTPREAFIRNFLKGHLSERIAIGMGEIIDANSKPNESRNQIDIVLYKQDYPKLDFGGNISGFLAESVIATIEVKSTLTKDELQNAMRAARNTKALARKIISVMTAGYQPPAILSFVVAYDGPASMKTVHGWLPDICWREDIIYPQLPTDSGRRIRTASPAIDAVFVLGRGFMHFGSTPTGFFHPDSLAQNPNFKWAIADTHEGNLLLLFLLLSAAVSGGSMAWFDPVPYLQDFRVAQLGHGT